MKQNVIETQILNCRYLPHNFLAEQIVLSCLLLKPQVLERIEGQIFPKTFYFKNHQVLYKIILTLYKKKLPIDILTVATFAQEKALLEQLGGINILLELNNQIPNLTYLEDYVWLLKEKAIRRSLIQLGYEMINSSYVTNLTLENIFKDLDAKLSVLNNFRYRSVIPDSNQIWNDIFLELKTKFLNPSLSGISSGFKNLDSITQGFQKSDLIILAGRPSLGKTAFSLNVALNVIKISRLPVIFFSLEMSKKQIMYRILSTETRINQSRLKTGQLYKNDWIKLNKMLKILSKLPIFMDDSPNLNIENVRSKLKSIILEHNTLGLVIIDYLQLIENNKNQCENRVEELSKITRQLKNIAREFNVPLIALSQLSRNVENRVNKKPILSDLRESGSIEQDADLVLMLSKTNVESQHSSLPRNTDLINLVIAKHRNGPIGNVKFQFDKNTTRFID